LKNAFVVYEKSGIYVCDAIHGGV